MPEPEAEHCFEVQLHRLERQRVGPIDVEGVEDDVDDFRAVCNAHNAHRRDNRRQRQLARVARRPLRHRDAAIEEFATARNRPERVHCRNKGRALHHANIVLRIRGGRVENQARYQREEGVQRAPA